MRRCDRCRTEYETGVDHGGKDYCMTCYSYVRNEEMRKQHDEERRRKSLDDQIKREETQRRNADVLRKMALEKRLMEEKRQRKLDDKKRADDAAARRERLREGEEKKRRRFYDAAQPVRVESGKVPDWRVPGTEIKMKHPVSLDSTKKREGEFRLSSLSSAPVISGENIPGEEEAALVLSVEKSLPVSLSCGQKGVRAVFIGKNASKKKIACELEVVLLDFKKNRLGVKVEPFHAAIDGEGTGSFFAEFDLKDNVPAGLLTLTAVLKENAVYVDRQPAKSSPVVLESKVKTAMDLEYRKETAKFVVESGAAVLVAEFYNRGETGGVLNLKSGVSFGKEGEMKNAKLAEKVKVKGMQKKVELKFAPAEKVAVERLAFELLGMDSNGKQYKGQKIVKEKIEDK